MNQAKSEAPGKIMLLGDHAVVYGYPCLVKAIAKMQIVSVKKIDSRKLIIRSSNLENDFEIVLSALDYNVPPKVVFIVRTVAIFFKIFGIKDGLEINISSEFPSIWGLGSSSAVTVALLKTLFKLYNQKITPEKLFSLAYQIVLEVQRVGSGFDVASAIYGGVICYQKNKPIKKLPDRKIPLLVIYSGIKADTVTLVNRVKELYDKNPVKISSVFTGIAEITQKGKTAYLESDWQTMGELFNKNHELLVELGISAPILDKLWKIALQEGAYGAKLSGAGGGDCLIVLFGKNNKEKLINAMEKNGGKVLDVL